jgi:hypothetical protein
MVLKKFYFKKLINYIDNDEIKKAKKYISKFFIRCSNGNHILKENNKLTVINHKVFNYVYLNRFGKDIKKWYMTKTMVYDKNNQ